MVFDEKLAAQVRAVLPGARPFDFAKWPMNGILYVSADSLKTAPALKKWIRRGVAFAKTLPASSRRTLSAGSCRGPSSAI
jgi:hypothetical protein